MINGNMQIINVIGKLAQVLDGMDKMIYLSHI
jgi:hypothetical protein